MTQWKYYEQRRIWYKGNEPPLFVYVFHDIPVTADNWKKCRRSYGSCTLITDSNDGLPVYNTSYNYRAPWFNDIEQFDKSRLKSHQLKNW